MRRMWITRALVAAAAAAKSAVACELNCHNSPPCGGAPLRYLAKTFTWTVLPNDAFDTVVVTTSLNTLDLSGRGITSIADDGLRCPGILPRTTNIERFNGTATQAILLDGNQLSAFPLPAVFNGVRVVSAEANRITALGDTAFSTGELLFVDLSDNGLRELSPSTFRVSADYLIVDLSGNQLTMLPPGSAEFGGHNLNLNISNNLITMIGADSLAVFNQNNMLLDLSHNVISVLPDGVFTFFNGNALVYDLSFNAITAVESGAFNKSSGQGLTVVDLTNNRIATLGQLFLGFGGIGALEIDVSNNQLNVSSLAATIGSFTGFMSQFVFSAKNNNITELTELFASFTGAIAQLSLDLSGNPLARIDANAFNFSQGGALNELILSVSNSRAGAIALPSTLSFAGNNWGFSGGSAQFGFSNTSVSLSIIHLLSLAANMAGGGLLVDVSKNGYTAVPAGVFNRSTISQLDLSGNRITTIAPDAFSYNLGMVSLDLSHNLLTIMPSLVVSSTPALQFFSVAHNRIWALPLTSHIVSPRQAEGNVLSCGVYGLLHTNCTCANGLIYSQGCGYSRCLSTVTGCPVETPLRVALPDGLCPSAMPIPKCLARCPAGKYYDMNLQQCFNVTDCATEFPQAGSLEEAYHPAYQFVAASWSSNRLCSICSTCPDGFDTTPCTSTQDSRCTRSSHLNNGDIAAISLAALLMIALVAAGVAYGKRQKSAREKTQSELMLTERLLGDVQHEKDIVTKEKSRMDQAWRITENDLSFGEMIGEGASGRVYKGTWGHIPVAIKVHHAPFQEDLSEDFHREVKLMSSIRHPHLLTFYGAGVDRHLRPFLVTELMSLGSLKDVLHDLARSLDWSTRLTFAADVAAGMRYLHSMGTFHRDLKPDNCFVDEVFRVKVADFGDSRFVRRGESGDGGRRSSVQSRTLTRGRGTLLWMAPELLRDTQISEEDASALDVYSFAIVLWEIWARRFPWEEILEQGLAFKNKLSTLVLTGTRPQLPTDQSRAPSGYFELMEQCWSDNPRTRPSFVDITITMAVIQRAHRVEESTL